MSFAAHLGRGVFSLNFPVCERFVTIWLQKCTMLLRNRIDPVKTHLRQTFFGRISSLEISVPFYGEDVTLLE